MLVRLVHPLKTDWLSLVRSAGRVTDCREVHPLNAWLAM